MANLIPTEPQPQWQGWTIPAIDAAIEARRRKHTAAVDRQDIEAALEHEGWLDYLLDGRLYLTATRRPS